MSHMRGWAVALACATGTATTSCGGGGGAAGSGNAALVHMTTTTVPLATTGVAYDATFEAQFPHAPGVFMVSGGALPPGLALDLQTGTLSGYPTQTGDFHFEVAARDGPDEVQLGGALPQGRDAQFSEDRRTFDLQVDLGPPNILPQELPGATYRSSYGYQIQLAGGTAPYTFAQTGGTLPAGIAVTPSGFLGSFPTQAQPTPYVFQVTVTDAHGLQDTQTLELRVLTLPLIILTSDPIPEAAAGFPYDLTLALASKGGGEPYTWSQLAVGGETNLGSIGMQVTNTWHVGDLGAGPTSIGTFTFTVKVTDEPGQIATRQLHLKVNPGPVVLNVSPNRASLPGPFTVTGLNFQPGAVVIFKPGPDQTVVTPTFVDSSTLTFNPPVPKPASGGGAVDVRVRNPDGGYHTKAAAFIFPATNLAFDTKGFVADSLSSTGLDAADVNGDGRGDIVHCGASGFVAYSGSPSSTNAGLHLLMNLGGSPPTFSTTVLDSASYYDVKFADVNVDGRLDVVALGATQIRTWLNGVSGNPPGVFSAGPISALPSGFSWPSSMTIGRMNSDSIPDLAFGVAHYPNSNLSGRVYTMTGNGAGGFTLADSAVSSIPNTYGVIALTATDTDGDSRAEICAGVGMNPYSGPIFNYSSLTTGAFFSGWTTRGGSITSPGYGSALVMISGDFTGTGTPAVVGCLSGSPNYSYVRFLAMFSGSSAATQTTLSAPSNTVKGGTPIDGDFDSKIDFALSLKDTQVIVWRSSAAGFGPTLDASVGSPSVSAPKVGRMASADLDGDGRPDLLAATSYWACETMGANYGSYYALGAVGNGGSIGVVFWLNTSN